MRTFWVNGLNKMGLESGTYVLASESEAEIAALRAEIDDYHDRLTAAAERERILNPCGHTGFESAPCAICGYPDPRNRIAALVERERVLVEALAKLREYLMGSSWREIKSPDEFIKAALEASDG